LQNNGLEGLEFVALGVFAGAICFGVGKLISLLFGF